MTVEEVAKEFGVGRNAIYAAIKEDRLPARHIRIGFRYLIIRADVEELLSAGGGLLAKDAAEAP